MINNNCIEMDIFLFSIRYEYSVLLISFYRILMHLQLAQIQFNLCIKCWAHIIHLRIYDFIEHTHTHTTTCIIAFDRDKCQNEYMENCVYTEWEEKRFSFGWPDWRVAEHSTYKFSRLYERRGALTQYYLAKLWPVAAVVFTAIVAVDKCTLVQLQEENR